MKARTLQLSAGFEWLRDMGITEANLIRLEERIRALPQRWKRHRSDETTRERRRRLARLSSRLRRLGKALDEDPDAAHISLTELRDNSSGGSDLVLTRSKFTNRPSIGAVLDLIADDLDNTRPGYLQWDRLISRERYVIGGILFELCETYGYSVSRTPNKHIAELASIVLRKRISTGTVRKTIQRLTGG